MGEVRVAAIDVGSDSTRLLVADVEGGELREVVRRSVPTHLAAGLYTHGELTPGARLRVLQALEGYAGEIQAHGCELTRAVMTSAVRDARNGAAFVADVRARFGIEADVIDGEDEALLTFDGATLARPPDRPTLVVDIGAGSTDFVVGDADGRHFPVSTQAGVARKSARYIRTDPPSEEDVAALSRGLREMIEAAVPADVRARVERGIAAAEAWTWRRALVGVDPGAAERLVLTRALIDAILPRLLELRLDELRAIPGIHPARAASLVAGTALVRETLEAFALDELEISDRGLLDGLALRLARAAIAR